MKRKTITALICIFLCLVFTTAAFAADRTFYLEEAGMEITFPEEYFFVTHDIEEDDPIFNLFETTKEDLLEIFLKDEIDLGAYSKDADQMISISIVNENNKDLDKLDDYMLDLLLSVMSMSIPENGVEVKEATFYEHDQALFVKTYFDDHYQTETGESVEHILEFYTVKNGATIYISLRSFSDDITQEEDEALSRIIDTIHFDTIEHETTPVVTSPQNTFYIDQVGMEISFPNDYITFSRDIEEDDPWLSWLEISKDELLEVLDEAGAELLIYPPDGYSSVLLTIDDYNMDFLHTASKESQYEFLDVITDAYEDVDYTVLESELYEHEQVIFTKHTCTLDGNYRIDYGTVIDGTYISLALESFYGEIISEEAAELQSIIDTIRFDDAPPKSTPAATTKALSPAFTYTDKNTGLSFAVPAGWTMQSVSGTGNLVHENFFSEQDDTTFFAFFIGDLYGQLSESEQESSHRSKFDNSLFSEEQFDELTSGEADEVFTTTYGEKEYYGMTFSPGKSVLGIKYTKPANAFFHIENGYMYGFLFIGEEDSPLYTEFLKMLEGVVYPEYEIPINPMDDASWPGMLYNPIVTLLFLLCPILLLRFVILRRPLRKIPAFIIILIYSILALFCMSILFMALFDTIFSGKYFILGSVFNYGILIWGKPKENGGKKDRIRCPRCGAVVKGDRTFCKKCGEPIEKEQYAYKDFVSFDTSSDPSPAPNPQGIVERETADFSGTPAQTYNEPCTEAPTEPAAEEENTNEATEEQKKTCPVCSFVMTSDSRFCPRCGTQIIE